MPIKGFLFDLDGVVVDTAVYHFEAWKRLANQKLGTDFTHQFNETLKGVSRTESLERILAHAHIILDEDTKLTYASLKNDWYLALVAQMTPANILPGVKDFFEDAQNSGIKIALGSASKNAVPILERIGMLSYFDAIIDGTKVAHSKPNPEVFLKGAAALGLQATECLVFEDAMAGIEAAKRGGMMAVGIGQADVLTEADWVTSTFEGLTVKKLLKLIQND
jgi:beta-phosphoglucomutase